MRHHIWIYILLCFWVSACSLFGPKPEKTAEELIREGEAQFEDGQYRNAIETFENLRDYYPFNEYTVTAELKIADAYFELGEYAEAAVAYEEFENLHPRNEKAPYAIYQIGQCWFVQMEGVDRDQTPAQKALENFDRLIRNFPDSPYAVKAAEDRITCLKNLAGNEFYVGKFYYKKKHYKAALVRFRAVISDYPDVGIHQKALKYIARCERAMAAAASDE